MSLPVASQRVGEFKRVAGVLVSGDASAPRALAIDVPLSGSVVAGTAAPALAAPALKLTPAATGADTALSLGTAIFFALVGGVLLNLMPCVFPVLSLKILGFATHRENNAAMRHHGLAFGAGVLVSFWLLAGVLIAFRAAGQQLGWGFQLQSPATIAALAVLFFVLALNLSGVFEVRQFVPSSLATWNAKNPLLNDVLSGALAVVVASPCSAPFMGAALGYALAGPTASTWVGFTVLAIGMALPYVLLAYFPTWRNRLPKPGAWMLRLKHLLAFPLYATVLWLTWVLGAQLDNDAVLRLGATLLLIALGLWAWQTMRTGGARGWGIAAAASIAGALAVGGPIVATAALDAESNVAKRSAADGPWSEYSAARVSQLVAAGHPVFVEFTAAWCVTCQVNKRLVLDTDAVRDAFTRQKVALLQKDWGSPGVTWLSIDSSNRDSGEFKTGAQLDAWMIAHEGSQKAVLIDGDSATARLYAARTTPHMFVIDPAGRIVYAGAIDDRPGASADETRKAKNYVRTALTAATGGAAVDPANTTPYGCSIKY